jgi:2-iminobutanoate/2-iminopropanoate deaminase
LSHPAVTVSTDVDQSEAGTASECLLTRRMDQIISRMPTHCGDDTCPSCVVAGDQIYLAHHAGGFDQDDVAHQTRCAFSAAAKTLASVGADLSDLVTVTLYLRDLADFRAARDVFAEIFPCGGPARMTATTSLLDPGCRCMIDGIAYHPGAGPSNMTSATTP